MKKLIMSMILSSALFVGASAQTTQDKTPAQTTHKAKASGTKMETKVKSKPTSTVPQKVNNIVRPKHKKYSGHKTKTKTGK
jgi:hypothetical protein